MSTHERNPSVELHSESNTRKRVCKACDRCRLKKSKCDGSSPCGRCKADNAICCYGERKKTHDKPYPKGYTQMLEQQHHQMKAAICDLYRELVKCGGWHGAHLQEQNGEPLTHDILKALGSLDLTIDGGRTHSGFEADLYELENKAWEQDAKPQRDGSISAHSDHGYYSGHSSNGASPKEPTSFRDPFSQARNLPTPLSSSPSHVQSKLPSTVPLAQVKSEQIHTLPACYTPAPPLQMDETSIFTADLMDFDQCPPFAMSFDQLTSAQYLAQAAPLTWNENMFDQYNLEMTGESL